MDDLGTSAAKVLLLGLLGWPWPEWLTGVGVVLPEDKNEEKLIKVNVTDRTAAEAALPREVLGVRVVIDEVGRGEAL